MIEKIKRVHQATGRSGKMHYKKRDNFQAEYNQFVEEAQFIKT